MHQIIIIPFPGLAARFYFEVQARANADVGRKLPFKGRCKADSRKENTRTYASRGAPYKKKKQQPAAAFRGAFERAAQAVDPNLAADKARPGL